MDDLESSPTYQDSIYDDNIDASEKVYSEIGGAEFPSVDHIIQKNISQNIRDLRTFFSSNNFVVEKHNPNTNIIDVAAKRPYLVPDGHIESLFMCLNQCRKEERIIHY